jgi:glycosidase
VGDRDRTLERHALVDGPQSRSVTCGLFKRGVAGFRVDVAHGLYKDKLLRGNPPADDDNELGARFGLRFVYNANQPETHGVYREWRQITESYSPPRLLLARLGPVASAS